MGACGLNSYLAKLKVPGIHGVCDQCSSEEETVEHFIKRCPAYNTQRGDFMQDTGLSEDDDLQEWFGGGEVDAEARQSVVIALDEYIKATGRFLASAERSDGEEESEEEQK